MSLETLEIPQPQNSEIPNPYPLAAEGNEAVVTSARNIWAEEIEAFAKAANINLPGEAESVAIDISHEAESVGEGNRVKDVFSKIRDLPYWAGAQLVSYTMVGKGSNREKRKKSLEQRKRLLSAGVGALAVANVSWNAYKSVKGLHATYQSNFLTDIPLPEALETSDKQGLGIDVSEVFDSALDYSYQGVDSTAHTLMNNFPKRRKTTKPKTPTSDT